MLVWIEDIINASKVIFIPLRITFSQKRCKSQGLNCGQWNNYSPVWYSQCALYNWIALKFTTQKICPYYYACQKCISFSQGNPQKCDIWKVIKESFQILQCVPYVPTNQLLTMPIIIHVNSSLLYSESNAVYFYAHGDCFIITIMVLHDVQFPFSQFILRFHVYVCPF